MNNDARWERRQEGCRKQENGVNTSYKKVRREHRKREEVRQ